MKASRPLPAALCLVLWLAPGPAAAAEVVPAAVSPRAAASTTASGDTTVAALTADGRFVVLASTAPDLSEPASPGGRVQLHWRDVQLGRSRLISATPEGAAGNGRCGAASVSADGRWVVFESDASDLVAGDTNQLRDVFLRDVETATTTLISRSAAGVPGWGGPSGEPVISADGSCIAYTSYATNLVAGYPDANRLPDLFYHRREDGTNRLASAMRWPPQTSQHGASAPVLSMDGRWLAFLSPNHVLAPGTPSGTQTLLYLRETAATTNLWATAGAAAFAGSIQYTLAEPGTFTADGGTLAYTYGPLVLRFDLATRETTLVGTNYVANLLPHLNEPALVVSADGQVYAWSGAPWRNGSPTREPNSVYVRDLAADTTTLVQPPVTDTNLIDQIGAPALSADGLKVGFAALIALPGEPGMPAGWNWCLHDRTTGQTTRLDLSPPFAPTSAVDLQGVLWAADLARLAFSSASPGWVAEDRNDALDAFLLDLSGRQVTLLSPAAAAVPQATAGAGSVARPGSFSADGRFLVFTSSAAVLDPTPDTNTAEDVFRRDLHTGSTLPVSVNQAGTATGNRASHSPVVSADGRFVAFSSLAGDLVAGDTNELVDVFVRDCEAGVTLLASRTAGGTGSGAGSSFAPWISANGQRIAFESTATNLTPQAIPDFNRTAGGTDVFVFDRLDQTNHVVSVKASGASTGGEASFLAALTPDGGQVVFLSRARDLVSPAPALPPAPTPLAYVRDLGIASTILITNRPSGTLGIAPYDPVRATLSAASHWLALATTNAFNGIVLRRFSDGELRFGPTNALSPSLSADGRLLAYTLQTNAQTPRQVHLADLEAGTTVLVSAARDGVSPGNGTSSSPVVSGDGRYVVFASVASDLVPRDDNGSTDLFVRDIATGRTLLLSATPSGSTGSDASLAPVLAQDGRTLAFLSWASDLVPGDANRAGDVFVLRLGSGPAADADADGLPDDWEVAYFNGLVRDGSGDADADGLDDRAEYRAGTDPTNEGSVLRVLTFTAPAAGGVTLVWSAVPGRTYRVQSKDTLDQPWVDLPGEVVAAGETASHQDPTAGASLSRFYRAVLTQ